MTSVMRAVRLLAPGGPGQLAVEEIDRPRPGPGDALVRVHAAAITRDELQWPVERLPAIPSYELSGVVEQVGAAVAGVAAGEEGFALIPVRPRRRRRRLHGPARRAPGGQAAPGPARGERRDPPARAHRLAGA